jgi:energy-coupling factor transport system ATP-binding protein
MHIETHQVSYCYDIPEGVWAIHDINLDIRQGDKIAITGPAGSGKTTLIQMLDALIMPTRGDILFDGVSVRHLAKARKLTAIRRRIGVLFQFPEHQFFQETAYDELAFAMRNFLKPDEATIAQRASDILAKFNMDVEKLRHVSPFRLSSGEKRKLALASALMLSPEVLILDEPTAGMDALGRRELLRLIAELENTTVIVVTHNLEDFLAIVHRIIGIREGSKVLDIPRPATAADIAAMETSEIVPPLVIEVQFWLQRQGIMLERAFYDMENLLSTLKAMNPSLPG